MERTLFIAVLLLAAALPLSASGQDVTQAPNTGWQTYSIGAGRGDATVSIGAQFWDDYFHIRNLIARSTLEIVPGIRAHLGARRREDGWEKAPFHLDIDEAYLEASTYYHTSDFDLAFDLKGGRMRYLRFPNPDYLSFFDQVPGVSDLTGGAETDYRGALFTFEGSHRSGAGFHYGGIQWGLDSPARGANAIEWYGFIRRGFGGWRLEGRLGALARRAEPLGQPARRGGSLLVAKKIGDFEIGAMVEKLTGFTTYTGVMVRFRPTNITRTLGSAGFDYSRSPEGFAVQYDLLHVRINEGLRAGDDEELVGEIKAVRYRTYWQQSLQRNEYEHRLSSWGDTRGSDLRVVVVEQPWRLDLEALVSPHVAPDNAWIRDRQGPAQLVQDVVYRFFRKCAR